MRALRAIAVATSVSLAAGMVHAETKTLARAGSWEAFGGTTNKGTGVCGISAEPGGRYFGLKLFAGGKNFTIQMGTSQWKIGDGKKVPLTLRFDDNSIWRATGTSFHFDDGDAGLQFDVTRSEIDNFAREFRNSSQLRVQFENDYSPQWIMGLEGTMAVNGAFQNCIRGLR